jgi:hypothetical protein
MFTDDDLKRLKEETNHHGGGKCPPACEYPLIDILGLLARLEAAEDYVIAPSGCCKNCDDIPDPTDEETEAYMRWKASRGEEWDEESGTWRKAAGK